MGILVAPNCCQQLVLLIFLILAIPVPVGVQNYFIGVLFYISMWLLILSTFSCGHWLFNLFVKCHWAILSSIVCLLLSNCKFWNIFWIHVLWHIYEYFLPVCGLLFHFISGVFHQIKVFSFDKVHFINVFLLRFMLFISYLSCLGFLQGHKYSYYVFF